MSKLKKKDNELVNQQIVRMMNEITDNGKPYFKNAVIAKIRREEDPEHFDEYADPVETSRSSTQRRFNAMVSDDRWPVAELNKAYLKSIGYPDHTHLYYLTDRPTPPPPRGDGSDVA